MTRKPWIFNMLWYWFLACKYRSDCRILLSGNTKWPTHIRDTVRVMFYWIKSFNFQVHNIVLYPDKHSWCTSTPIKQVISDVDCEPVEIDNRVCLGACFSYSIPRTLPANNADEINSYCDSCQPINMSWIPVSLRRNVVLYIRCLSTLNIS